MKVIRKELNPREVSPTNIRYNPDCDCTEQTYDDGVTWVENVWVDPRLSPANAFPPSNEKCQSAANMSRFINNTLDEALNTIAFGGDFISIALMILPFLLEFGPFAIIFDLVIALAFLIASSGATAISAAFTNEVYDTLTCIFFCEIGGDGSVTAEQLGRINAAVDVQIGGLAATVLHAVFLMMGHVGLQNVGTRGDAPADCDECGCDYCYHWNMLETDGDFIPRLSGTDWGGVWTDGVGWYNPNASSLNIGRQLPIDTRVTSLSFSSSASGAVAVACYENADYTGTVYFRVNAVDSGALDVFCPAGSWIVIINGSSTDYPFQEYRNISAVELHGIGDEPFGESNC